MIRELFVRVPNTVLPRISSPISSIGSAQPRSEPFFNLFGLSKKYSISDKQILTTPSSYIALATTRSQTPVFLFFERDPNSEIPDSVTFWSPELSHSSYAWQVSPPRHPIRLYVIIMVRLARLHLTATVSTLNHKNVELLPKSQTHWFLC